jgi:predicted ABC-type ATPase
LKRASDDPPRLWIVAGPNGCGKSTVYGQSDVLDLESVWIVNPDLLTARLRQQERLEPDDANLAAVRRIESWLNASIEVHQTIGVETVLSTAKYRELVHKAKQHGFVVSLIYVFVATVELQLARIRGRVAKGGHDVPEDKVRARRGRSLEQLSWFFWEADDVWVFDNSSAEPTLVLSRQGDRVELSHLAPREILDVLGMRGLTG